MKDPSLVGRRLEVGIWLVLQADVVTLDAVVLVNKSLGHEADDPGDPIFVALVIPQELLLLAGIIQKGFEPSRFLLLLPGCKRLAVLGQYAVDAAAAGLDLGLENGLPGGALDVEVLEMAVMLVVGQLVEDDILDQLLGRLDLPVCLSKGASQGQASTAIVTPREDIVRSTSQNLISLQGECHAIGAWKETGA